MEARQAVAAFRSLQFKHVFAKWNVKRVMKSANHESQITNRGILNMPKRLANKRLVGPEDFEPTSDEFRIIGAFNPGAVRFGDDIILLVRVVQAVNDAIDSGWLRSPRSLVVDGEVHYEIDRLEIAGRDGAADHRKPQLVSGHRRLAFVSHIELVRLAADGYTIKEIVRSPQLFGRTDYEEYGVEDPRITEVDGRFYITYVSVSDAMGVATSLMSTTDFVNFERHGVIFPCENKDVVLFPERIGGRVHCHHRPVGAINIRKLAITAGSSPDLIDWGRHHRVLGCEATGWRSSRIGAGTPPIKTEAGWLSIIHGVEKLGDDAVGTYTAGAMLNPLDNPSRVLAVSQKAFFKSENDYEIDGYVKNVVFPTGAVRDLEDPDRLHVYYGCADSVVAVATYSIEAILKSLRKA
jgi:predicted GH43/DUF377 family glycosyl hydrolase